MLVAQTMSLPTDDCEQNNGAALVMPAVTSTALLLLLPRLCRCCCFGCRDSVA
jgi:hypothetical protein